MFKRIKITFTLLSVLIVISAFKQIKVKGNTVKKIKSIFEITYRQIQFQNTNEIINFYQEAYYKEYSPSGQILMFNTFFNDNSGINRGNILNQKIYNYDSRDSLSEIKEIDVEYNKVSKTEYLYDNNGVSQVLYYTDNVLINEKRIEYETVSNYRLIKESEFNSGKLTSIIEKKYNNINQLITKKEWSEYSPDTIVIKNKYDIQGNLIEVIDYDFVNETYYTIFNKYDDKSNLIEHSFLNEIKMYKYDLFNNIIEEESWYNGNFTNKNTYSYKYDTDGNWIEKIEYEGKKPIYITKRNIRYY